MRDDVFARIKFNKPRNWLERLLCKCPGVVDYAVSRWRRDPYLMSGAQHITFTDHDSPLVEGGISIENYVFCTEVEIDENKIMFYAVYGSKDKELPVMLPGEDAYEYCERAAQAPEVAKVFVCKPLPVVGEVIQAGYFEYTCATKRVMVQLQVPRSEKPEKVIVSSSDDNTGTPKVLTHRRFRRDRPTPPDGEGPPDNPA